MAQDIGLDFAAGPSVSGLFAAAITAGNSDTSNSIDFGESTSVCPGEVGFAVKIVSGTGTPDGNKQWVVKIKWSHDNTDFTDDDLASFVAAGTVVASATDIVHVSVHVQARYAQILVDNDQVAGPQIETASSISVYDVFGNFA